MHAETSTRALGACKRACSSTSGLSDLRVPTHIKKSHGAETEVTGVSEATWTVQSGAMLFTRGER